MSEAFYKTVRLVGRGVFRIASDPLVLHRERAERPGPFILAANHASPFDAPLLIAATPRVIYWLSIVEIFQTRFSRWFLSGMLATPLDRSKVDTATMRTMARHLRAGRVIGIFPEGRLRSGEQSVLQGGGMREGVCKLAELSGAPVVPCVVAGSEKFHRWRSWIPFARTRYVIAFGDAIAPAVDLPRSEARARMAEQIQASMRALAEEVQGHA